MDASKNIIKIVYKNFREEVIDATIVTNYEELFEWLKEPLSEDNSNNEFVANIVNSGDGVKLLIKRFIEAFLEMDCYKISETERSKKFHNR